MRTIRFVAFVVPIICYITSADAKIGIDYLNGQYTLDGAQYDVDNNKNNKKDPDELKNQPSLYDNLGLNVNFETGTEFNFWQPKNSGLEIVDYDTTGFMGYYVFGQVGVLPGSPIVTIKYSAPFEGTSTQKELLRIDEKKQKSGYEDFLIRFGLGSIVNELIAANNQSGHPEFFRSLSRFLGSFEPSYNAQHFFGNVKAYQPIAVVGPGTVQTGSVLSGGISPLNPGEHLSFRTSFEMYRAMFDLTADQNKDPQKEDYWVKIGYFDINYRRPTVNGAPGASYFRCQTCGSGSRYLLFDTTFKSQGVGLDFYNSASQKLANGDRLKTWLGGNFDFGIDSSVSVEGSDINLYPKGVNYIGMGLRGGLRYNFDKMLSGFYAGFEGEVDSHNWNSVRTQFLKDNDWREKIFIRVGYIW